MESLFDWIQKLSNKKFHIFSFIFFLLMSIIIRLPTFFFDFFSNDEAAHFIGSIIIKKGMDLYSDFVDNKPPFIYLFYLLSQVLFGETMTAVHITTTMLIIPSIAFFTSLSINHISRIAGLMAGFFYILFTSSYIPTDMFATNCEIIMLLFASVGFTFILKNSLLDSFLFGIFISLATLSKQHSLIWILVPLISELTKGKEKSLTRIFSSLLGFFIPILISLIYFYTKGSLIDFIYFTVGHNITYSQNPIFISEIFKRFFKYLFPFIILVSPLIFFYVNSRRVIDREIRRIFEPTLVLSILIIFVGFRLFPHYYIQTIYPLSILAAFYFLKPQIKKGAIKFIFLYSLLLMTIIHLYTFLTYSKKTDFIEETEPLFVNIPREIKREGLCKDVSEQNYNRVFVWGYAPLFYYYFYKECSFLPASRFILPQASIAGYIPGNESQLKGDFQFEKYIIKEHRRLLMRDLEKNRPLVIIDTSGSNFHNWGRYPLKSFPELNDFIQKNYKLLRDIEGFRIYIKHSLN
ncbi:MAG: hypothetical protein N2746_09560 [Deltaproteobacteria bacterium]|nr:hypothetical protein [Deltaproteobacteria bacterium]